MYSSCHPDYPRPSPCLQVTHTPKLKQISVTGPNPYLKVNITQPRHTIPLSSCWCQFACINTPQQQIIVVGNVKSTLFDLHFIRHHVCRPTSLQHWCCANIIVLTALVCKQTGCHHQYMSPTSAKLVCYIEKGISIQYYISLCTLCTAM